MEDMAAPNLSHTSATMSIVCLAVLSIARSAKRRASSARQCQYLGSLNCGAGGMERTLLYHPTQEAASSFGIASADRFKFL